MIVLFDLHLQKKDSNLKIKREEHIYVSGALSAFKPCRHKMLCVWDTIKVSGKLLPTKYLFFITRIWTFKESYAKLWDQFLLDISIGFGCNIFKGVGNWTLHWQWLVSTIDEPNVYVHNYKIGYKIHIIMPTKKIEVVQDILNIQDITLFI